MEDHNDQEDRSDKEKDEEEEVKDWPSTEDYQKKRQTQERAGRSSKRVKLGRETLPRLEGVQKRKGYITRETEFEKACKRLRPEFDPEVECDKHENQLKVVDTLAQKAEKTSNTIPLFSIFCNSTPKNVQPKKSKPTAKIKRKVKTKQSLTTDASQARGRVDIRTYFSNSSQDSLIEGLEAANTAASQQESSQSRPGPKWVIGEGSQQRKNAKNRARESETYWDPGLLKEEEVG